MTTAAAYPVLKQNGNGQKRQKSPLKISFLQRFVQHNAIQEETKLVEKAPGYLDFAHFRQEQFSA